MFLTELDGLLLDEADVLPLLPLLLLLLFELAPLLAFAAACISARSWSETVAQLVLLLSLPPGSSHCTKTYKMAKAIRPIITSLTRRLDFWTWDSLSLAVRYWMPAIVTPITPRIPMPIDKMSTTRLRTVKMPQPWPSSLRLPKKVVSVILSEVSAAKTGFVMNDRMHTERLSSTRMVSVCLRLCLKMMQNVFINIILLYHVFRLCYDGSMSDDYEKAFKEDLRKKALSDSLKKSKNQADKSKLAWGLVIALVVVVMIESIAFGVYAANSSIEVGEGDEAATEEDVTPEDYVLDYGENYDDDGNIIALEQNCTSNEGDKYSFDYNMNYGYYDNGGGLVETGTYELINESLVAIKNPDSAKNGTVLYYDGQSVADGLKLYYCDGEK